MTRDSDLTGATCRAWRVTAAPETPDQTATLTAWLVHGGFHPLWSYWMIAVIHLREIAGVRPSHKSYPAATHEFMIVSLESAPGSAHVHPDPDDPKSFKPLMPPDVVWQFDGLDDAKASRLADLAVKAIIAGHASPDVDWRSWWLEALPKTAEHLGSGRPRGASIRVTRDYREVRILDSR